ncbi:MAG: hypothetical protein Kow0042_11480 [Calditrichia bacterium]
MAAFWENLQGEMEQEGLQTEATLLEKYWFAGMVQKAGTSSFDYFTENLHPAFCLIRLGEYLHAFDVADLFLENIREDSRLRTYQAFCLKKLKKENLARDLLAFALFYDPFQVEEKYVFDPDITRLLSAAGD